MIAKKDDKEKLKYHLIPPSSLEALATIFTFGAHKYGEFNWTAGFKQSRLFASCMRHLWAWYGGETIDPESGKSHLWHAFTNLSMMIENEKFEDRDDRFFRKK